MDIPFKIFDKDAEKYLHVLEFVLISDDKFTLLPELMSVFGEETLLKFIDIFGGCTLKIPPRSYIDDAIRDVVIYVEYTNAKVKKDAVSMLSDKYSLTDKRIKQIVNKIASLQGFTVEVENEKQ